MIKLNEKYYLDSDSMNYILMEKKIYEKGKNIGEEYYNNIAFIGSLERVAEVLIEKGTKDNIEVINNVNDLIQFKKDMTELVKNIKNI